MPIKRPRNIIFIPARKGSTRIEKKNLQTIDSSTLIEICIKKAINLRNDNSQIILSTDFSNKELNLNEFLFKNIVIHKRSIQVSQNNSSTESTLKELLEVDNFKQYKESNGYVLMMQVTSPLVEIESIQKGIDLFLSSQKNNTTVFSAYKYKQFTWVEKGTNFEPISYDPYNRNNTQMMQDYFQETGGFYIFPIKGFLKKLNRFMDYRTPLIINQIESLDIDEIEDLNTARKYYKSH